MTSRAAFLSLILFVLILPNRAVEFPLPGPNGEMLLNLGANNAEGILWVEPNRTFLTAGFNGLFLWDLATGTILTYYLTPEPIREIKKAENADRLVAIAGDPHSEAGFKGNSVFVFKFSTLELERVIEWPYAPHYEDWVYSTRYSDISSDGRYIILKDYPFVLSTARIVDLNTGELRLILREPRGMTVDYVGFDEEKNLWLMGAGPFLYWYDWNGTIIQTRSLQLIPPITVDVTGYDPIHDTNPFFWADGSPYLLTRTDYSTGYLNYFEHYMLFKKSGEGFGENTTYLDVGPIEKLTQVWSFPPDVFFLAHRGGMKKIAIHAESVPEQTEVHFPSDEYNRIDLAPDQRTVIQALGQKEFVKNDTHAFQAFDLVSGASRTLSLPIPDSYRSFEFFPDQPIALFLSRSTISRLYDTRAWVPLQDLLPDITAAAVHLSGRTIALGVKNGTQAEIVLWDVEQKRTIHQRALAPDMECRVLRYSPNGNLLAAGMMSGGIGDDPMLAILDAGTLKEQTKPQGKSASILSLAFSPDGKKLVSGEQNSDAQVWDVDSGRVLMKLPHEMGFSNPINDVRFSADGKEVQTVGRFEVCFWNAMTGEPLREMQLNYQRSILSPDGRYLLNGHDLWNWENRKVLYHFPDCLTSFEHWSAAAFTPDNKALLITASQDSSTRVWDLSSILPSDSNVEEYRRHE